MSEILQNIGEEIGRFSIKHEISSTQNSYLDKELAKNPDIPLQVVYFKEQNSSEGLSAGQPKWLFYDKNSETNYKGNLPFRPFEPDNSTTLLMFNLKSGGSFYGKYRNGGDKTVFELHYQPAAGRMNLSDRNEIIPSLDPKQRIANAREMLRGIRYLKDIFSGMYNLPKVDHVYGVTNKGMADFVKAKFPKTNCVQLSEDAYSILLNVSDLL